MKTAEKIYLSVFTSALGLLIAFGITATRSTADDSSSPQTTTVQDSQTARQQSDDLLRRARQAMAENDLQSAGKLISQAETLAVRYGPIHLGDTPQKAGRDLKRKLAERNSTPSKGGLLPPMFSSAKRAPASDPFAQYNSEPASGTTNSAASPAGQVQITGVQDGRSVRPLPPVDRTTPTMLPIPAKASSPLGSSRPFSSTASNNQHRAESDQLLLASRRALAYGDVRTATSKIEQAKRLNVPYGPMDDTPEKVEAVVARYAGLMALRADRGDTEAFRHQFARLLTDQAQGLMRWRDYNEAERLAETAARQGVNFGPFEVQPRKLLERIAAERNGTPAVAAIPQAGLGGNPGVVAASAEFVTPATGQAGYDSRASSAVYDPHNDPTQNVRASNQQNQVPGAEGYSRLAQAAPSRGMDLFQQGEKALRNHEVDKALDFFRQSAAYSGELDPITAQRLQDMLLMLSSTSQASQGTSPPSMLDEAAAKQQVLLRQVMADVTHQESNARKISQSDPKAALELLAETRKMVEASGLEPNTRDQLLRRVDRTLDETQRFIDENRPKIELDEQNQQVRDQIERERSLNLEIQDKVSQMVAEYNQLMEQQQYLAAEVVAKRAAELDPTNPLADQLVLNAKLIRRVNSNLALQAEKEEGFMGAMRAVDTSGIPFDDMVPYRFNRNAEEWKDLIQRRTKFTEAGGRRRNERELEIEQKLQTPVSLQFDNTPLSQVMDYLAKLAGVNLHLDPQGLAEEGISTDDPVTIKLPQEISLKSALNLILDERHLSYVIKDEVLKITSEQYRDGETYAQTYNVADLVVPIPNFMPSSSQMGLGGALKDAMGNAGFGGIAPFGGQAGPMAVANRYGANSSATLNPSVLAQQMPSGMGGAGVGPMNMPTGMGSGPMGGAANADFDSLIDLITTTVQPTSWDTVGGPGSIAPFATNLSLVISQTQEVHEEIVDLLEQLRRMQDLQVTIEVRFITLNDNFFERIGVDFDFDIDDDIDGRDNIVFGQIIGDDDDDNEEPNRNTLDVDHDPSVTVGMSAPGVFNADLDIPFTQNSFGLSVPQFGGFDATAGAQLGFAILSDIEAFFFISAAQGDRRSNVMQAPKVTLFNGQQAYVSDTSQSPFVISVIPVVGDFAAAQQPVIVVLNEGTFLTVQAVVSDDRRFVRLTVVPYFSRIGEVNTFTFEGSETTTENTSQQGIQEEPNDNSRNAADRSFTRQGTTVQLPTFSFVTVTTTVSVPDGGTVLLGGIKRLSEGRNEFGVPILNKIPYVNRLFKNVGIGRETQSLMMMVTPRIIIQEEEEEKLGILTE